MVSRNHGNSFFERVNEAAVAPTETEEEADNMFQNDQLDRL
jgi:hypothetical protein